MNSPNLSFLIYVIKWMGKQSLVDTSGWHSMRRDKFVKKEALVENTEIKILHPQNEEDWKYEGENSWN